MFLTFRKLPSHQAIEKKAMMAGAQAATAAATAAAAAATHQDAMQV
jgi:hypothetical protein